MKTIHSVFLFTIPILLISCHSSEKKLEIQKAKATADSIQAISDSFNLARVNAWKEKKRIQDSINNRPWKLNNFVDSFGDSTDEKYIETTVEGTFSNSATVDSYLYVEILFTKKSAGIFLHEYKMSSPSKKIIGNALIELKNSKNETISLLSREEWGTNGGIKIVNLDLGPKFDYYLHFVRFIKRSIGEIKVVITDEYSSTFRFKIDATGFAKEFNQL